MPFKIRDQIKLDFSGAKKFDKAIRSLSGAVAQGDWLWTVSDEGRSLECLKRDRGGYRLVRQIMLDKAITGIPGDDEERGNELDLESLDIEAGRLWLCGSHSRARPSSKPPALPPPEAKGRPSREFLASFALSEQGQDLEEPRLAPGGGAGGLRAVLAGVACLKPFLELPSKENGLDVEGFVAAGDRLYFGLRGPIIEGWAIVAELIWSAGALTGPPTLHFLELNGLGVRDLAKQGDSLLVLAGPGGKAVGPHQLFRWSPGDPNRVQTPTPLFAWPVRKKAVEGGGDAEKPEGICLLKRKGRDGVLVVYDTPSAERLTGMTYAADWLTED